jgi:hypothetical protein
MGQAVSDAAVELLGACPHSVRFAFGAPLDYPYAAARLVRHNPPPVLFRRMIAASPPPKRDGAPWKTGLVTSGGEFDPDSPPTQLGEVRAEEGAIALGLPDPDDIVLDWWFSVPRARQTMTFPGSDRDRCFLSVPYWSPPASYESTATRQVEYFAIHRLPWARSPRDKWVALSFDAFWPPERDSADVIVPLASCDASCPASV